jgi:hypothetical protein
MFAVQIYERTAKGVSEELWTEYPVPAAPAGSPLKDGRVVSSADSPWPQKLPVAGRLIVTLSGKEVLRSDFELDGPPLISPKTEASRAGLPPGFEGAGLVRIKPRSGDEIAEEFAGFAELPDVRWLRVGPLKGPSGEPAGHVVQLRLVKETPNDMFRDFQSGAYYVYAVQRCVVQSLPGAV